MGSIVCFIDKIRMPETCSEEARGKNTIDCKKCSFYKKFKDKEKEEFIYTFWTGEIKEKKDRKGR